MNFCLWWQKVEPHKVKRRLDFEPFTSPKRVKLTRQQMRARGENIHIFGGKNEATTVCSFPSELSPLRALIMAVVIVFKWDCTLVARLQSCKPIQNCFSPLLLVVSCCSSERLAMINYLNMLEKRSLSMTVVSRRPAKDKLKIRLYNSSKKKRGCC